MTDLTRETLPTPGTRRPLVPVEVPSWGGAVYVRRLSASQATALPEATEAFLGALLLQSVVLADGTPLWASEAEAMEYPMEDLQPLVTAALAVNGLVAGAVEEKKEP